MPPHFLLSKGQIPRARVLSVKLRVEQLHLAVVSLSTVVTHVSSLQHYAFLPAGYVDGSAPGTFEGTQNE